MDKKVNKKHVHSVRSMSTLFGEKTHHTRGGEGQKKKRKKKKKQKTPQDSQTTNKHATRDIQNRRTKAKRRERPRPFRPQTDKRRLLHTLNLLQDTDKSHLAGVGVFFNESSPGDTKRRKKKCPTRTETHTFLPLSQSS